MQKLSIILCVLILGFMMNSCKKKAANPSSPTPYTVRMTDAPGPYNAVFIDLQQVEITGNDGNTLLLNVHPGIYNLLNFSNGIDTIIATGSLNISSVEQIRLILGPNNTVVVDNVTYPLSTPSAEQSGLKLQVHQMLQAGVAYSVILDFDANKSIVDEGSGKYKLKPVLRTIETALSGAIKGYVTPAGIAAFVTVTSNVSYSSNVNSSGNFLIMGLPAGTYSVNISPAAPLLPVTINNIIVTTGSTTDMGKIAF